MLSGMLLSIDNFKFITRHSLTDWSINELKEFLEQASNVNNDDEKIKELYKKYLPELLEFCEKSYIQHNECIKYENEELLENDSSKDELQALASDKMIIELADDFLNNIVIPIAQDFLKNKKNNK